MLLLTSILNGSGSLDVGINSRGAGHISNVAGEFI